MSAVINSITTGIDAGAKSFVYAFEFKDGCTKIGVSRRPRARAKSLTNSMGVQWRNYPASCAWGRDPYLESVDMEKSA